MMKATLLLLLAVFSTLPLFSARSQTVVTFDDINVALTPGYATNIPTGYQGLIWSNFWVNNSILTFQSGHVDGYYYGMVSPSNVAFNASGNPAEIDSATNFNFLSVYLTGAWNSNLNIEVEGFNGAQEIYNTIVVASATNPTLFTFNYLDINRLYFNSYGGEPAFTPYSENNFVMDNFTFEFVPEPSSLLLTMLGVLMLWACRKRRAA
ncbi:MAG: PEP-CTERM sorting domain-containing protein [Verrucomicrobiia bacterium]|jgi:hypothetical protein